MVSRPSVRRVLGIAAVLKSTTLVVLLAAFMGDAWREAYRVALARGYRFLSFGDAMLARRAR